MISIPNEAFKDADAIKEWVFDATLWLCLDTIASFSLTVDSGLTLDSSSNTDTAVTAWFSGGTVGQKYTVICRIVTAGGRTDDCKVTFYIT